MPTRSIAKQDTAAVIASIIAADELLSDVVAVEVLDGYRLWVRFDDGVEGQVDISQRVRSPRAGVFAALADPDIFAKAYIESGAVTWAGRTRSCAGRHA